MKNIFCLLLVLCLGLVGCNKTDYGIFTKEAYNTFNDEERAEIQYRYDILKNGIEINDVPDRTSYTWVKDERESKERAPIVSRMSNEAVQISANLTSMSILLQESLNGNEEAYSEYVWKLIETDDLLTKEAQDELLLKTVSLLDN